MNIVQKLMHYQLEQLRIAEYTIQQSNPDLAYGDGLAKLSNALGLGGRYDVPRIDFSPWETGPTRTDDFRPETDVELRIRILKALGAWDVL
jgi:hypothetical protein